MIPVLVVFFFLFSFFFSPPAKGAWMVVLGVRIESVEECCQPVFSSQYTIVQRIKLMDLLNRWQG